jgi:hypothetical protein
LQVWLAVRSVLIIVVARSRTPKTNKTIARPC